jgi:uncharacterized protein (DUF736 family)
MASTPLTGHSIQSSRMNRSSPSTSLTVSEKPVHRSSVLTIFATGYRVLSQGIEIGAGWLRTGQTSGKEYVALSMAAPEFGARTLYANLGRAAGQSDDNVYALIWNPQD